MMKFDKEEFNKLIKNYEQSEVVQRMSQYIQHGNTTTYDHCKNVAKASYKLNKRFNLKADEGRMVRAAMLHDLFLYDWHDGKPERRTHGFHHADIACKNAKKYFHIPKSELDIIKCHMWPLNITRVPRSREAWIVCMADKYCTISEVLKKNK